MILVPDEANDAKRMHAVIKKKHIHAQITRRHLSSERTIVG